MPLKKDMNKNEICEYLEYDLKKSIFNDIQPIIQLNNIEGGYFGVPRLVLCYVDFLGSLYDGYNRETDRSGRKKISTSKKAKRYIKNVFSKVHPLYKAYGDFLYEMYRHGTVHLYQPKTFINRHTKETLSWLTYKGPRIAELKNYGKVNHMNPKKQNGSTHWILPISINCLFDDLVDSIEFYKDMIKKDDNLVENWSKTANVLVIDEETNLKWSII